MSAIVGVLSVLAGLVCLRRPGESLMALIVVLGIYLVIAGLIRFVRAFSVLEDRALVMGHGNIVFDGTPDGLRADAGVRKEWLEV